ncbi:RNA polymerase sigma factor [Zhongshania aliphaticivorans]|uniref:RNA polymerase sigma factor n=1 Tax=Zhongshania aliphaticivorans TaxID=1470434 RepID=UPI0039C9DE02
MANILSWRRKSISSADDILNSHLPELYRMAYRLSGNQADSEDLIQELAAKFLSKPNQLDKLDSPQTWLKRSLYNLFVDGYRRSKLQPVTFSTITGADDADFTDQLVDSAAGPADQAQNEQLQQQLQTALESLPVNQRDLVILHDVEGMPLTELENILQEPLGTLKSRLHRARKSLRFFLVDATF